jgi:hypothetical protein
MAASRGNWNKILRWQSPETVMLDRAVIAAMILTHVDPVFCEDSFPLSFSRILYQTFDNFYLLQIVSFLALFA